MLILLSNDDGVEAPGLRALVEALAAPDVEIVVSAPREEQSAKSHSLTLYEPLRVEPWTPRIPAQLGPNGGVSWHAVGGTPADCVYVGVHRLCARRPDVVISGINFGTNLGDDVHYSGTVAAAMEGALIGIPAIAVSLGTGDRDPGDPIFETAGVFARRVMRALVADPLPRHMFLNLNVPGRPLDAVAGLKVTPMGKRYYHPLVQMNRDPRGRAYYWLGGPHDRFDGWDRFDAPPAALDPAALDPAGSEPAPEEDLDGAWSERGYATLTPLHPDLTAIEALGRVKRWSLDTPESSEP